MDDIPKSIDLQFAYDNLQIAKITSRNLWTSPNLCIISKVCSFSVAYNSPKPKQKPSIGSIEILK